MTDYRNLRIFKKSQVNGLTRAILAQRFEGYSSQSEAWDKIFKLSESFGLEVSYSQAYGERLDFVKPRKITKEQTELGKTWLKSYFFKLDGKPRRGKRTENVNEHVLQIARRVTRFEFVGVQVLASSGWWPSQAVPIYRSYDRTGSYFDYSPIHWGEPIIHDFELKGVRS